MQLPNFLDISRISLLAFVPQGAWEICATAVDAVSESGPSNVVPWQYAIIVKPNNARVQ
uniref:Uncharacterized protein n=1 Tax=viral metagenome TaxID=1070528 RepID=A0A6M3JUF1_9ZZZZ